MDKKYLVSVIVPVYKVEKYLPKCVDSILSQTYSNIEIILVNDGSPDRCGEICDEYAKKDARIRVIHRENGGLSAARNSGMDVATGDFVMFVDSDDWIELNAVEVCIDKILEEEQRGIAVDVLCFSYYKVLEGKEKEKTPYKNNPEYMGKIYDSKEVWITSLHDCTIFQIPVCFKIFRTSAIKCMRFKEGIVAEDNVFIKSLYTIVPNLVTKIIDTPLYNYVINRSGSIMNTTSLRRAHLEGLLSGCYQTYEKEKEKKEQGTDLDSHYLDYLSTYIVKEYIDYYILSIVLRLPEYNDRTSLVREWLPIIRKMPLSRDIKYYYQFRLFQISPWIHGMIMRLKHHRK